MSKPQYQNKDWQNAFKNVNHPDPSSAQDVATKNYVDTVARGLKYKTVRARTTANITIATDLNSGDIIDGVTLADGDLVLVDSQSTASQDGIYTVGAVPARTTGVNGLEAGDDARGLAVSVAEGTANGDKTFVQTAEPAIVGTDGLTFGVLGGSSGLTIAGAGLLESPAGTVNLVAGDTSLTANTDDTVVNLATNGGLEVSSGVKVKLDGASLTLGASGLKVTTPVDTSVHARWGTALGPGSAGATITQAHGFGHKSLIVQVKIESSGLDITDGVEVVCDATNIVVTFGASQADRSAFRLVWVG
jgi:hypothetical protein